MSSSQNERSDASDSLILVTFKGIQEDPFAVRRLSSYHEMMEEIRRVTCQWDPSVRWRDLQISVRAAKGTIPTQVILSPESWQHVYTAVSVIELVFPCAQQSRSLSSQILRELHRTSALLRTDNGHAPAADGEEEMGSQAQVQSDNRTAMNRVVPQKTLSQRPAAKGRNTSSIIHLDSGLDVDSDEDASGTPLVSPRAALLQKQASQDLPNRVNPNPRQPVVSSSTGSADPNDDRSRSHGALRDRPKELPGFPTFAQHLQLERDWKQRNPDAPWIVPPKQVHQAARAFLVSGTHGRLTIRQRVWLGRRRRTTSAEKNYPLPLISDGRDLYSALIRAHKKSNKSCVHRSVHSTVNTLSAARSMLPSGSFIEDWINICPVCSQRA